MKRQTVSLRIVAGNEFDPALHDRGHEGNISREPIELGYDEHCSGLPAELQCLGELGAILPLSALDLDELSDRRVRISNQVPPDSLPLSFKPESGLSLLLGGNSEIGSVSKVFHGIHDLTRLINVR